MTGLVERARALPPRWMALGGGAMAVTLGLVALVAAGNDEGRLGGGALDEPVPDATVVSSSVAPPPATPPRTTVPTTVRPTTTVASSSTVPVIPVDIDDAYRLTVDAEVPAVEGRTIPDEPSDDEPPPSTVAPPPWAASTTITPAGHVATAVGCADDLAAASLDRFLSSRVGPVIGWDYQHVYPLGGDRYLWLFQDAFVDHSGTKTTLGAARFVHNAAMVQDGRCFTLLHRGTADRPLPFEVGDGSVDTRTTWLWPMGGELVGGRLWVFWAEMVKDPYDPDPPDGLGWHPRRVHLAAYDAVTLERVQYERARNSDPVPIYGYAVASDDDYTYLFGNTFEQNLVREGGFWNGPHSATAMYLARVPFGLMTEWPEYRTEDGWSYAPDDAVPIVERFFAENPMQPRHLDGQWVAATAVDGYWGDHLAIDVADHPWGPWTTVQYTPLLPRYADPKMNTYHAQPLPWRDAFGSVQITVSNNARNMVRDAWPYPHRYRPAVLFTPYTPTPSPPTTSSTTTTTTTTTTPPPRSEPTTTTISASTTSTTTTVSATTTTTTTTTTTSTTSPTTTTASTTTAPTTTTTTTITTTTTTPSTTTASTTTTSVAPGG